MPSFHIFVEKIRKDKYMKWNFWVCGATLLAAAVMIVYYAGSGETKNHREQEYTEKRGDGQDLENTREELPIRVLIKNDNFESVYHDNPAVTCGRDFQVQEENGIYRMAAGEEYRLGEAAWAVVSPLPEGECQTSPETEDGRLFILGLARSQEQPRYSGCLELRRTADGVVVINQLPLEDYLPSVLSSEMSARFPMEALKAQAVCARTYALKKIGAGAVSGFDADLDDSVSFQVYNNMEKTPETIQAVEETRGQILTEKQGGESVLAEVYYYSTSCGVTAADHFSTEEEFEKFITSVRSTDMEAEEAWYRWRAEVSAEGLLKNLEDVPAGSQNFPLEMEVSERRENGQANRLQVVFGDGTVKTVEGEYTIRKVLTPEEGTLILQDGSTCSGLGMLPSAWFVADTQPEEGRFLLIGGGYGHGNGLSQNGARRMAEQGKDYYEILEFYYPGTKIDEE